MTPTQTPQVVSPNIYKTERFRYSTTSHKGVFVKILYRFRSDRTGQPVGIQLSVSEENRVKITTGILDKDNRIIKDFEAWKDEVIKLNETRLWCITRSE